MPPIVWMFIVFCVIALGIGASQHWEIVFLAAAVGVGIWVAIKVIKKNKQGGVRVSRSSASDNRV